MFSCGSTNTAIALAELVKGLGHTATLINHIGTKDWWDDCKPIKKLFTTLNLTDTPLPETPLFDLIFEIGSYTLTISQRSSLTRSSIWILRKPFVLGEIESSIFPMAVKPRCMDGIKESWLLTHVAPSDDLSALETFTRKPVRILPFLWTPIIAEVHHRSINAPAWKGDENAKLFVHMVDTNSSSASSSTIPLVILREAARQNLPIETWRLHNGEQLAKSRFFRENILKHCSDLDLSGQCVGRQRCVEWTAFTNNVVVSHLRFRTLRPVLLDLTWVGIPVVHNSIALKEVKCGLDALYYTDNSIYEGAMAIKAMTRMIQTDLSGWTESLKQRREQLLFRWSPVSPFIKKEWDAHISRFSPAVAVPKTIIVPASDASEFTILFCDMWDDFQADYNFFTLLLNRAGESMSPPRKVVGCSKTTLGSRQPNLVLFGPFGNSWTQYPGLPKVHFTGENSKPIQNPEVGLNLAFPHYDMAGKDYLRFPLWITEIDWFSADVDRIVNPKPIPLELCTRTNEDSFASRNKFCSFIVTNPKNPLRNQSFHWLNDYKQVDSAGALYNTIGGRLIAGCEGGGGGELRKTAFMMDYKFALTFENSSSKGYCTEKYLHAKASGAIPIYWGDPEFQRDFNPEGCIDARGINSKEDLIALVKACESEEEWKKRAAVPALDAYQVEMTRKKLAELAKRIYTLLGADSTSIPNSIGTEPGTPAAKKGMEFFTKKAVVPQASVSSLQVPLLVSYVTFNFLGSLQHWLTAAKNQLKVFPDMKALVFTGPDVSEETLAALREKYTYADFEPVPSTWTPPDFPDFWEPLHFAWKIWIYHTLVNRPALKGKLILYMDAGAVLVRFPKVWMMAAQENGIACLEDPREENERWCGDTFCELLSVSEEERMQKQIVAGIMCFVGGHPTASAFFQEAFKHAQNRDVIVGPRLSGVSVDGKSYGHRQDQSILSILVRRHPIPLHPLDTVYGDHSMRRTFQSGQGIYVHRGDFKKSVPFLPGIEDAYVINLDRRADRMESFWKHHPELEGRVHRQPAYDGKELKMTPELAELFKPNDFFWKKAVMGCAMSHLSLWWKLVNEHPDIHNFLIFEDDARLEPGWESVLENSMAHIPENYDVLYLGGILPPNRSGFEQLLEPVTKYYSRIKPHTAFGQKEPNRYFHSCAYAYILSRNGAVKIMQMLQEKKGYWTSADHIMCSPCDTMNLYFLTPTLAGCFQDSDPAYANSEFNNFSRVDTFDSDLWNNDERFAIPVETPSSSFDLALLLRQIYDKKPSLSVQPTHTAVEPYRGPTILDANGQGLPGRFLRLEDHAIDFSKVYEGDWLMQLFGVKSITLGTVDLSGAAPADCPIVIMQRPYVPAITALLKRWSAEGASFKILHFSDEAEDPRMHDSIEAYSLSGCKSVLRFYIRNDIPDGLNVHIIPLGYRWSCLNLKQNPLNLTPHLPFRDIHWSFYGTDWCGRKEMMKPLLECGLVNSHKFYEKWNDPMNLSKQSYMQILLNTVFVPCPSGLNSETFRIYEALEAGCIPLIIHTEKNDAWYRWLSSHIPILDLKSWSDAIRNMMQLLSKPETLEIYRTSLLNQWVQWASVLKQETRGWLLS